MSSAATLQLQITLRHIKPRIWRRIRVSGESTLEQLHRTIQLCMGWTDSHLHSFRDAQGQGYGNLLHDEDNFFSWKDERLVSVADVLPQEKASLVYEYDFGDGWEHDIKLEKRLPLHPGETLPRCLHAVGACPPEDVGGVGGFYEFLEALADPSHPEHEQVQEWWGEEEFDTSNPSVDEINMLLAIQDEAGQVMARHNNKGLDDLAGLSPHTLHGLLYQTYSRPDILQWSAPENPETAPIMRMLKVLLEAMGDKGLKLTPKGNLPVAVVRAMIDAGIAEQLSRYARFEGAARSEDDSLAVQVCRVIAELGGYIHKQKGRLLPRKRVLTLVQQGHWGQMYLHLLECATTHFNWAYMGRHDEMPGIQTTAPFTLWLLYIAGEKWQEESSLVDDWLEAFPVLEEEAQSLSFSSARRQVSNAMSHRLSHIYQWFGLIEQRQNPGRDELGLLVDSWSIRKGPLFDQVIRFVPGQ
ncbi:MAG: plasmid pRiA4b ORF-3 family protein [Pseudomonas sp.]